MGKKSNPIRYRNLAFASVEDIASYLSRAASETREGIKRLKILRREVLVKGHRIDDADSILEYIDMHMSYFHGYEFDLERVSRELPNGIKEAHFDILDKIHEVSCFESKESHTFKLDHICKTLKDEELRPLIDEIYSLTRTVNSSNKSLSAISDRLETFKETIPKSTSSKTGKAIVKIPVPPGTSWESIGIKFLSNVGIDISFRNQHEGKQYQEIGFGDNRSRTGKPSVLWLALVTFAKCNGEVSYDDEEIHPLVRENLKFHVYRISRIMRQIFGISEKAFCNYNKKKRSWTAKFGISLFNEEAYEDIATSFRDIQQQEEEKLFDPKKRKTY